MTDRTTVRMVVGFLGAFALVGMMGLIWLVGHDTPGETLALIGTPTGTALGALGMVLSSARTDPTDEEIKTALAPLSTAGGGIPVVGLDGGPVVTTEAGKPKRGGGS